MAQKMRASLEEGRAREEKAAASSKFSYQYTFGFLCHLAENMRVRSQDKNEQSLSKRMKLVLFRLRLVKHKIYSHQFFNTFP